MVQVGDIVQDSRDPYGPIGVVRLINPANGSMHVYPLPGDTSWPGSGYLSMNVSTVNVVPNPTNQVTTLPYQPQEADSPAMASPTNGIPVITQQLSSSIEPGADLRDFGMGETLEAEGDPFAGGVHEGLSQASLLALALRLLGLLLGRATRVTTGAWSSLPGWARTVLAATGIGVGTDIAVHQVNPDVPTIPQGGLPMEDGVTQHLDIPGVHLGAHVIGGWVANGVSFYRLSNGQIAVQRKNGTWKVYRPPKPIVLMPTGSGDLRTLLRADAVITKQAKRIRAMLDRRAPRPRRSTAGAQKATEVVVIEGSKGTHT